MKKFGAVPIMLFLMVIAAAAMGCGAACRDPVDKDPNVMLSLDKVVETFNRKGVHLYKNESKSLDLFEIKGVKPAVFTFGKGKDSLLIYIFDSYVEEEGINPFSLEKVSFPARNSLIVYMPAQIPESPDTWESNGTPQTDKEVAKSLEDFQTKMLSLVRTRNLIADIVFRNLNDGKVVTYVGDSTHWKATVELKYWEHFWVDEKGTYHYSNYHTEQHQLRYKMDDVEEVGSITYVFCNNKRVYPTICVNSKIGIR